MSFDPSLYKICIQKVEVDGDTYFEASVHELPDVREYAATYQDAYDLAIDTIETAHSMFRKQGRAFPIPAKSHEDLDAEYSALVDEYWDYLIVATLR